MVGHRSSVASHIPIHLGVRLQCPRCRMAMSHLECQVCGFRMKTANEIVQALPPERIAYYAKFMEDYELIRAAEGRGSEREEFYLGLPYFDASGKNSAQWHIRARSYDCLIQDVLRTIPQRGERRILDIGAGNCWMSFRLALAEFRPVAVDLLTNPVDGLGAAAHYRGYLCELFPRFQAEAAYLPFQDEQFDAVVFNASFHYSEDYEKTLGEALRCLRSGGKVVISDTPWYSCEESGEAMVAERHDTFLRKYGTASNSIRSIQYVTDERLRALAKQLSIKWTVHSPQYGIKWAIRPWWAKLQNRREPSRFRIYSAIKDARDES
jgi:SAM-dependent methyltransferase